MKCTGPDEQLAGPPVSPVEKTPISVPMGGRGRERGRIEGKMGRRGEKVRGRRRPRGKRKY